MPAANYEQLPINAPKAPVNSYMKDGAMTYRHAGAQPVYAPNSHGGPKADPTTEPPTWWVEAAELGRYPYEKHAEDDDFGQAGTLYREVLDDAGRGSLVSNIVDHASQGVSDDVQDRVIAYWSSVDPGLGARVAAGLGQRDGAAATSTLGAKVMTLSRKLAVEFIGTFLLMFTVGMASATAGNVAPLAVGAIIVVMVFAGGHISGGHYNPAISTAVMLRGKLPAGDWAGYLAAQIVAAILAGLLVSGLGCGPANAITGAGRGRARCSSSSSCSRSRSVTWS